VPAVVESLGFSPDARVLIVNCDDFGMSRSINAGVVRAIEGGIASSCSLMVPCDAAAEAMQILGERPDIRFGVHLTLVRDSVDQRWSPVCSAEEVSSLLDGSGVLPLARDVPALLARARLEEIEREFRAQIEVVLRAGLEPTHLDWHCLADGGRGDVMALTLGLALEYGLAMRAWGDPAREALRRRGLAAVDHDFLDSFSLELDGKFDRYQQLLRAVPAGLTEWAVHPAACEAGAGVRSSDFEFLVSAQAADTIRSAQIHVISYQPLRESWRRRGLSSER
jgi:predicted glycoside hydrolase/deacetylase ChbG (UPF0249 family)